MESKSDGLFKVVNDVEYDDYYDLQFFQVEISDGHIVGLRFTDYEFEDEEDFECPAKHVKAYIPPDLHRLPCLKKLVIIFCTEFIGNSWYDVPLNDLKNLESLHLVGCCPKHLENALKTMPKLKTLVLKNLTLITFERFEADGAVNIRTVKTSSLDMIGDLKQLESLKLSDITVQFSEKILELPRLNSLHMENIFLNDESKAILEQLKKKGVNVTDR